MLFIWVLQKKNQPHLPIKHLLVSIVTIIIIVVKRGIEHH
jgi:hypothetical protein